MLLAGLTRELGHGPFSILFEKIVVPRLQSEDDEEWKHNKGSAAMLNRIYGQDEIIRCFRMYELNSKDFEFIKSLILCEPNEEATGRGRNKRFLYHVLPNENGIDVDKWDYLARDSYHLGVKCGFDYTRLLYNMRVLEVDGVPQICVKNTEADTVYSLFHTRFELYKKAYQHKAVLAVELMIAEALVKAENYLKFSGKTISQCLKDMKAYTGLHDGIFYKILESEDVNLQESRKLLEKLQARKLWKFVGQARLPLKLKMPDDDRHRIKEEISKKLENDNHQVKLHICTRNFGQAGCNPLDSLMFYGKHNPAPQKLTDEERKYAILPEEFQHIWLRAYYTGEERHVPPEVKAAVKEKFENADNRLKFIDY